MVAGAINQPRVVISEDQAKAMAAAVAHVQSFYPNKANAKTLAWANLAMIAGAIYGPMVMDILNANKPAAGNHGLQAA